MAATPDQQPWSFDVSSLMVLVSEGEEEKYRLSQRSFLQCLAMAPVVGLQNYVRSYEFLLDAANLNYFSPDGVKGAPLRYMRLSNAIKHEGLLEDSRYTVYGIPDSVRNENAPIRPGVRKYHILIALWVFFTWVIFAGVLVFAIMVPNTTWIGKTNCCAFTGWSILLRLIEYFNIKLAKINDRRITGPTEPDAVYILGRNNSAFVLEGTRKDIKYWTTRGLVYQKSTLGVPCWVWQGFTRLGSLLMLLFIFSSIPNASTMDQIAFIILNGLAQVNVMVGQRLNSASCLSELDLKPDALQTPETRTHVYGLLIRRYKDLEKKKSWVDASGMLPQTDVWKKWKPEVLKDDGRDAKDIYEHFDKLDRQQAGEGPPNPAPAGAVQNGA
jgi:hypothetical protein